MGTLTADTPSLPEHCDHKLPTSCRLTATARCCACQDLRPHSSNYSTYVDGVGMVMRGTRWQRYCYYCREFWANRVAATDPPIPPADTRVPQVPDQTPFIQKWFEYHRGYRMVARDEQGTFEREELTPEKPWKDVEPGTLPVMNSSERRMALRVAQNPTARAQDHISLESTLDNLLEQASEDQSENSSSPEDARTAAELNRQQRRQTLSTALQEAQQRLNQANRRVTSVQLRKQRAQCELRAAERELRTTQEQRQQADRDQRAAAAALRMLDTQEEVNQRSAERFARVFGTREEIQSQGAEYISPLTTMFTRAYERYRIAEEVREQDRESTTNAERHRRVVEELAHRGYPQLLAAATAGGVEREATLEEALQTLDDNNDQRPPPKTDEEMTIRLACRVCLQQRADIAVVPCGHLVMCSYCADICVPARPNDYSTPVGRKSCPLCRKQVKKRVRIFTS